MPLVEANRPRRGRPRSNKDRSRRNHPQMLDQLATNTAPLLPRQNVSVANQIDVAHVLNSHHTDQLALRLVAPERDAISDLALELLHRHVRLMPTVGRNRCAISLGGFINDRQDPIALVRATWPDCGNKTLASRLPLPASRFPLPASRFPPKTSTP